MSNTQRNIANPFPRLALSCVLTVWAGANLWSCIFRWNDIMTEDIPSRTIGLFLAILFAVLPMVVAIYLFWTIVVGAEDDTRNKNRGSQNKLSQYKSGKRPAKK